MPVAILRPNGNGAHAEWMPTGAATAWQAVASSGGGYITASADGQRAHFTFDDLPASATGVVAVSVYSMAGASASPETTCSHVLTLSGTDDAGPDFTPPDGGYDVASTAYATAPGGLAWTVARVNALEGGINTTEPPSFGIACDELWLYVEYSVAAPVGLGQRRDVRAAPSVAVVDRSAGGNVLDRIPGSALNRSTGLPLDTRRGSDSFPRVEFDPEEF